MQVPTLVPSVGRVTNQQAASGPTSERDNTQPMSVCRDTTSTAATASTVERAHRSVAHWIEIVKNTAARRPTDAVELPTRTADSNSGGGACGRDVVNAAQQDRHRANQADRPALELPPTGADEGFASYKDARDAAKVPERQNAFVRARIAMRRQGAKLDAAVGHLGSRLDNWRNARGYEHTTSSTSTDVGAR
jgi:hypothetical protein